MKTFTRFLICLGLALAFAPSAFAQTLAFPGAEGYGKFALGGRGGEIYFVTNLNDAGPGSLRAGCEPAHASPRTIIFTVSGLITLSKPITISQPKLTIAGQTAPGGGICLRMNPTNQLTVWKDWDQQDACIIVKASDIIIRYLRLRPGPGSMDFPPLPGEPLGTNGLPLVWPRDSNDVQINDALDVKAGTNIVVDHCSASWGWDETINIWGTSGTQPKLPGPQKVTIQNCIISEGLSRLNPANQWRDSYGSLAGDGSATSPAMKNTYFNNLFAHNEQRNIMLWTVFQAPAATPYPWQFVNNVIYNRKWFGTVVFGFAQIDLVKNYYIAGPQIVTGRHDIQVFENGRLYLLGNIGQFRTSDSGPETDIVGDGAVNNGIPALTPAQIATFISTNSFAGLDYTNPAFSTNPGYISQIKSAADAKTDILTGGIIGASRRLDSFGNWVVTRDAVDARAVADAINLTGTSVKDIEMGTGIYTYPILAAGTPNVDTDGDGMPDDWENGRGLNPANPADRNTATIAPPYTNLEAFLSGLHGIPPTLGFVRLGNTIVLSWPTNATGFTLESATNFGAATVWSSNPPAPVVFGSNYVVTNSMSGNQKFYRLKQ